MEDLVKRVNLGPFIVEKLKSIGIENLDQLKSIGSESVFLKLYTIDPDSCINRLFSLEGAIQGIRWHNLSPERKMELRDFFNQLKKSG